MSKFLRVTSWVVMGLIASLLAACGGGGGGSSTALCGSSNQSIGFSYPSNLSLTTSSTSSITIDPTVTNMPAACQDKDTYTITSGSLPDGLSINSSTGTISGVVKTAVPLTVNVTVSLGIEGYSNKLTANLSFKVAANVCGGGSTTMTALNPTFTYPTSTTSYSGSLTVTPTVSGVPSSCTTKTFALASGASLPVGLTLDTSTGAITGTTSSVVTVNATVNLSVSGYTGTKSTIASFTVQPPATISSWTSGTLLARGYSFVQSVTVGSAVYAIALPNSSAAVNNVVLKYDGTNWSEVSNATGTIPSNLSYYAIASDGSTEIVLLGGATNDSAETKNLALYRFNIGNSTWSSISGVITNTSGLTRHQMAYVNSTYIIAGGATNGYNVQVLKLIGNALFEVAPNWGTGLAMRRGSCLVAKGSDLFLIGGLTTDGTNFINSKQVWKSTDTGATWTKVADSVSADAGSFYGGCATVNGRLYYGFGGNYSSSGVFQSVVNTVYSSSDSGATWRAEATPTYNSSNWAGRMMLAFSTLGSKLVAAGGSDDRYVYKETAASAP